MPRSKQASDSCSSSEKKHSKGHSSSHHKRKSSSDKHKSKKHKLDKLCQSLVDYIDFTEHELDVVRLNYITMQIKMLERRRRRREGYKVPPGNIIKHNLESFFEFAV
jgi:hypothetical protein